MSEIKILLCAANPEVKNLQLAAEQREIEERVERAERALQKVDPARERVTFDFTILGSTRSRDLLRLLQLHKPQVLHMSGHGARGGELLLDTAESALLAKESRRVVGKNLLLEIVREFAQTLRVVFLNVCYSVTESQSLVDHIDCVIAMNGTIEDSVALTFAATFYEQCALGSSVARAFRLAQAEVSLYSGEPALCQIPQLLIRKGVDPERLFLVGIEAGQRVHNHVSQSAEMRILISQRLPYDAALQAFLLAYYPNVARQLGDNMQRTVKLNLLLTLERDLDRLRERLESFCSEQTVEMM